MMGGVKVLGGVLVLGAIATADMAAFQAHAQMHPAVSGFDAIFADVFLGGGDLDLVQMATLWHAFLQFDRVPAPHGPICPAWPRPRTHFGRNSKCRLQATARGAHRHT